MAKGLKCSYICPTNLHSILTEGTLALRLKFTVFLNKFVDTVKVGLMLTTYRIKNPNATSFLIRQAQRGIFYVQYYVHIILQVYVVQLIIHILLDKFTLKSYKLQLLETSVGIYNFEALISSNTRITNLIRFQLKLSYDFYSTL